MKKDRFVFALLLSWPWLFHPRGHRQDRRRPQLHPLRQQEMFRKARSLLIYSDAFLDAKTGIGRFNTLITTLNREFQPRQTELQGNAEENPDA